MNRRKWFVTPAFVLLAVLTLEFSINVIGARLFLIYRFGWAKVKHEHIRILRMPKGGPWPLSNGEWIRDGFFTHFLISGACWIVLFVACVGSFEFIRHRFARKIPRE